VANLKHIAIGETAPDFTAPAAGRGDATLSKLRGQRVWLAFFRYAGCPLCNMRISQMIKDAKHYEDERLAILAVFQSPAARLERYLGPLNPPFPLVSDPAEQLYALYGLEKSLAGFLAPAVGPKLVKAMAAGFFPRATDGSKTRIPGDFLIDENGVVADAFYGKNIGDHIPFERVESFLARNK